MYFFSQHKEAILWPIPSQYWLKKQIDLRALDEDLLEWGICWVVLVGSSLMKMLRWWRWWECGVVWQAGCKLAGGEGMRGIAGTIYRSNIQLDPHTPAYTFFLHGTQTMAVFFEQLDTTSKAWMRYIGQPDHMKKANSGPDLYHMIISDIRLYIQLSTYKISAM